MFIYAWKVIQEQVILFLSGFTHKLWGNLISLQFFN